MAKYHFVAKPFQPKIEKDLPNDRITVEYGKYSYDPFGTFLKAAFFLNKERKMIIGNCEGSLMVIDVLRDTSVNPINKLHIGGLTIKRPHAESYEEKGEKGVRVDLSDFDTHYAKKALAELIEWRDPRYRERLLEDYATYHWYCVPFRVQQLKISSAGLEEKIEELIKHIGDLRSPLKRKKRRLVSDKTKLMELNCYTMVQLMNFEVRGREIELGSLRAEGKLTNAKEKSPKIIVNRDIFSLTRLISNDLAKVLDFICPQIDVERARNYWQEVASWSEL